MKKWFVENEDQAHHSICLILIFKTPNTGDAFPFNWCHGQVTLLGSSAFGSADIQCSSTIWHSFQKKKEKKKKKEKEVCNFKVFRR